jgi:hypothetical protein
MVGDENWMVRLPDQRLVRLASTPPPYPNHLPDNEKLDGAAAGWLE